MKYFILVILVSILLVVLLLNSTTRRIKKINALLNKDRSVGDFINTLQDWKISPVKCDGLRMVIFPENLPKYYLYITYRDRRPENKDISKLYHALTDGESVVTKAHKMNVPVEQLIYDKQLICIKKAIDCVKDMMAHEITYYKKAGLKDMVYILAKPTAIIDRFALIYAVATTLLNKTIHKEIYALELIDNMVNSGIITKKAEDYAIFRLEERINYFIDEIQIEKKCSSFIPTAMIYTLRHPNEPPTKDITKIDPIQALIQWNIILKVIDRHFGSNIEI